MTNCVVRNVTGATLFLYVALNVNLSLAQQQPMPVVQPVDATWLQGQTDQASALTTLDSLQAEIDAQAAELETLRESFSKYDSIFGESGGSEPACGCSPKTRLLPVVAEQTIEPSCGAEGDTADDYHKIDFYPTYDRGFVLRSFDQKKMPYELIIPGWIQFRHHGFARDVENWTDNAGVTRPVRNRNAFDIERARIYFLGWVHDERLRFFFHLDGDSDGRHGVDFFDYWWSWDFTDRFRVQVGKRKVPASRQWLLGARRTRFVDRPMSTDFFRPDRTIGIYGIGKTGDTGNYEVMVGNGYRTSNIPNSQTDNKFTFAATQYFDPFGKYGSQLSDYDYSCNPLMRFGHSFVYSPQSDDQLGAPLDETDFMRLSDGTRLNQTGALAPGVTVSDFDLYYYSVDLAMKYRGWSFNSEVYFQWLDELRGDGALPIDSLYRNGYFVEGGRFLIPKKLDVNARYSEVQGEFGGASEIAAGINWYPLDSSKLKVSFDATRLDGSPLQNTATDILVGDDGMLFRTQIQAEF